MSNNYNEALCNERHKHIEESLSEIKTRIAGIEYYGKGILLALAVGLCMQFVGLDRPRAIVPPVHAETAR